MELEGNDTSAQRLHRLKDYKITGKHVRENCWATLDYLSVDTHFACVKVKQCVGGGQVWRVWRSSKTCVEVKSC